MRSNFLFRIPGKTPGILLLAACFVAVPLLGTQTATATQDGTFRRIATFPVFLNNSVDDEAVAEIVSVTKDGNTLVYTDSELENVGFVDIQDPANPLADGVVELGGEPTAVSVVKSGKREYALVGVNTSESFTNPSGYLAVIDIESRTIVREIDLGGQPDSVAVSPDNRYAAIAIENERDEDLGNGEPPQSPPGYVVIVKIQAIPNSWSTRKVDLVGIADVFPEDPEPEFVDINSDNIAAVTLQENNHVVLINCRNAKVIGDFNCGSVDLENIDTIENGLIQQDSSLSGVVREPDAIAWTSKNQLATADEGDLFGGSRGFTLFDTGGNVQFGSGNSLEHDVARIGHYPEERSENKGNEPEGMEYGQYGLSRYLFVGSERSSVIFVYRLPMLEGIPFMDSQPEQVQILPAGTAPEGLLAIPERNLFVVASEDDDRGAYRASITIYELTAGEPTYPTIVSEDRSPGVPIPFGALSALAGDRDEANIAYTAYDSFYNSSRIFRVDASSFPAVITDEIVITDGGQPIDVDVEGLATREDGGFWVATEGAGSVDDPDRPVTSMNTLIRTDNAGAVQETVMLPAAVNAKQRRFGFEGVTSVGSGVDEAVFVCFQREWVDDPSGLIRIGRYEVGSGEWTFYYYPREAVQSPNGGWVGLSEIVALDDETFAVIERDNQGGPDAAIKHIKTFSIAGLVPQDDSQAPNFPVVTPVLVRDLIPDLLGDNGAVIEKVEGLTVLGSGETLVVTDNDGVDDNSGETQFLKLTDVFED